MIGSQNKKYLGKSKLKVTNFAHGKTQLAPKCSDVSSSTKKIINNKQNFNFWSDWHLLELVKEISLIYLTKRLWAKDDHL